MSAKCRGMVRRLGRRNHRKQKIKKIIKEREKKDYFFLVKGMFEKSLFFA